MNIDKNDTPSRANYLNASGTNDSVSSVVGRKVESLVEQEPIFLKTEDRKNGRDKLLILLPEEVLSNGMIVCRSSRQGSKSIYLIATRGNGTYSVFRKGNESDTDLEKLTGTYTSLDKNSRLYYFINHIVPGNIITLLVQGRREDFIVEKVYTNGSNKRILLHGDNKRAEINFIPSDIRIAMGEEVLYNLIDNDNGQVSEEEAAYFISRD